MVDRYNSECAELCHFPNDKGEWVRYADYEALEAKLLQVKHAYNQRLKPSFDYVDGNAVALGEDEIDRLESKLAALVEAAKGVSITASYLVLDLKGHGFKMAEKLEAEVSELKAALDAAKVTL